MLTLALLAAVANGQEVRPIGLEDVVAVDTTTSDTVRFALRSCDDVRAIWYDQRRTEAERTDKLVITLHNGGGSMCLYRGLVLAGSLAGVYKSSLRNPDGTGFFIPPGGEISFRIKPDDPTVPREVVSLQIPPGSGTIVLRGLAASEAPPEPLPER